MDWFPVVWLVSIILCAGILSQVNKTAIGLLSGIFLGPLGIPLALLYKFYTTRIAVKERLSSGNRTYTKEQYIPRVVEKHLQNPVTARAYAEEHGLSLDEIKLQIQKGLINGYSHQDILYIDDPRKTDVRHLSLTAKLKSGYKWPDKDAFYHEYYKFLGGKRDAWVWLYGIFAPALYIARAILGYKDLEGKALPPEIMQALLKYDVIIFSITLTVCLSFFFGRVWARKGMFALPFVAAISYYIIMDGILTKDAITKIITQMIAMSIIPLLIYSLVISWSASTNAFFGLSVRKDALERHWKAMSNPFARYAAILGILFPVVAIVPVAPLVTLGLLERGSIAMMVLAAAFILLGLGAFAWLVTKALNIYSPQAIPPITGRSYAAMGLVAILGWFALLVYRLLDYL